MPAHCLLAQLAPISTAVVEQCVCVCVCLCIPDTIQYGSAVCKKKEKKSQNRSPPPHPLNTHQTANAWPLYHKNQTFNFHWTRPFSQSLHTHTRRNALTHTHTQTHTHTCSHTD